MTCEILTEYQWEIAHQIALYLAKEQYRLEPDKKGIQSEFEKVLSYLIAVFNRENCINLFFDYLEALCNNGKSIGHSGKTLDYNVSIQEICKDYLHAFSDKPEYILQIIGWSARLLRYYSSKSIIELETIPIVLPQKMISERQAAIAASVTGKKFEVGQVVEAKIVSKKDKGKEVTYEILGTSIKKSIKEQKAYNTLSVDQIVLVEILDIDDGKPKKFKRKE